jgi:hypothetical protein
MADEPIPTYHVDIWTPTPSYVCQLCVPAEAFRGTVDEVTQHLQDVHQAEAIPTPQMDKLLALRADSDVLSAQRATPHPSPSDADEKEPAHG